MTTSLVLRNSKADGTSKNGFQWPKSGPVECMDWNPAAQCGGLGCAVQAGDNGCFSTAYFDEKAKRNRILVGYVGEDGILSDTPYRVKVLKSGKAKWEVAK